MTTGSTATIQRRRRQSPETLSMECELNGVVHQLHLLAAQGHQAEQEQEASTMISPLVWNQASQACQQLIEQRAKRLTALQSTFPTLHFAVLAALGGSILVAFLMETNQDILVFLNAIQLRLLWSILVGTLSVLAVVCYDLSHPFRGSYQISKRTSMVDQLQTIRQGIYLSLARRRQNEQQQQQPYKRASEQATKSLTEEEQDLEDERRMTTPRGVGRLDAGNESGAWEG